MAVSITLSAAQANIAFQSLALEAERARRIGDYAYMADCKRLRDRLADAAAVARARESVMCGACRGPRSTDVSPCGLDRHADICDRCDADLDHPAPKAARRPVRSIVHGESSFARR